MDRSGTKADAALVAASADWVRAAEAALREWRGQEAALALETTSGVMHDALAGRFGGRAFVIAFSCAEGGRTIRGALLCEDAATRAALGLDDGASVRGAVDAFAAAFAPHAEAIGVGAITVHEEHCVELTRDGLATLRTALPVEPLRLFSAAIQIAPETSLTVGIALHDAEPDLGHELSHLARMGVGQDRRDADARAPQGDERLGLLMDVDLPLIVRLGESQLTLEEVLRLRPGSVIELNRLVNEPVELIVNNRTVAYGEVVVVDETFGLRVTSLADTNAEIFA